MFYFNYSLNFLVVFINFFIIIHVYDLDYK